MRLRDFRHFDWSEVRFIVTKRIIFYALFVVAIGGEIASYALGLTDLAILGLYIAIPMLAAGLIYLEHPTPTVSESLDSSLNFKIPLTAFSILYALSVCLLILSDVRPLSYFLTIATLASLLFVEIAAFNQLRHRVALILAQMVLLSLNIVWGVTLKYFFFVGGTDTIVHAWFIQNLVETPMISHNTLGIYEWFPLWHLLNYFLYELLGLNIAARKVMFITNGFVYAVVILSTFSVVKRFTRVRTALFAALLLFLNLFFIYYGMYSIARGVMPLFINLALLLVFSKFQEREVTIFAIFTAGIIVYHTASVPFILLIFGMFYVLQRVYSTEKGWRITLPSLVVIAVGALAYWMFVGTRIFAKIALLAVSSAPSGAQSPISGAGIPISEVINFLSFSPIAFLAFLGVLWGLSNNHYSTGLKVLLIMGIVSIGVTFPGPIYLLDRFLTNFNFPRIGTYTLLFVTIPAAVGLATFHRSWRGPAATLGLALLVFSAAFLGVSNDYVAKDNPAVEREAVNTFYLSEQEIQSMDTLNKYSNGYIFSDYILHRYALASPYANRAHILEVNRDGNQILTQQRSDLVVIREGELQRRHLKMYSTSSDMFEERPNWQYQLEVHSASSPALRSLSMRSVVYQSGEVAAYPG